MISTICFDSRERAFNEHVAPTDIGELCQDGKHIAWVDVTAPTEEDLQILAEQFGFHPLAMEDAGKEHQRTKVDEYDGYYFIVLYEIEFVNDNRHLELRELNIFLGKNYVVTVHAQPIRAIETARRLWPRWRDRAKHGAALLAYLLMDAIVDDYMLLGDSLNEQIELIEDRLFDDDDPATIQDIFKFKKKVLHIRRAIAPLRDVFNQILRREQPIFPRETMLYFQDVFDHVLRVLDNIDTLRETLGSTVDAYLSMTSNRMNEIMERLTSASIILMSVTLIAGIYGMNFKIMPELDWKYGYVAALSSMLFLGIGLYIYFKRRDWL